jgi:hypothetical protein
MTLVIGSPVMPASLKTMNRAAMVAGVSVLVGCGASTAPTNQSTTPAPADTTTAATTAPAATESENLARLKALQVFDVGALLVDAPEGAFSCYGPCPDYKDAIAKAQQAADARLGRLVTVAEKAAKQPAPAGACDTSAINANVAALEALRIVHVAGLLVEAPKTSPSCYNQPCPGAEDAARVITCTRAGKLANIAAAAKGL